MNRRWWWWKDVWNGEGCGKTQMFEDERVAGKVRFKRSRHKCRQVSGRARHDTTLLVTLLADAPSVALSGQAALPFLNESKPEEPLASPVPGPSGNFKTRISFHCAFGLQAASRTSHRVRAGVQKTLTSRLKPLPARFPSISLCDFNLRYGSSFCF